MYVILTTDGAEKKYVEDGTTLYILFSADKNKAQRFATIADAVRVKNLILSLYPKKHSQIFKILSK